MLSVVVHHPDNASIDMVVVFLGGGSTVGKSLSHSVRRFSVGDC